MTKLTKEQREGLLKAKSDLEMVATNADKSEAESGAGSAFERDVTGFLAIADQLRRAAADAARREDIMAELRSSLSGMEMSESTRRRFESANADYDGLLLTARKVKQMAETFELLAAGAREARRNLFDGTRDLSAHFGDFVDSIIADQG